MSSKYKIKPINILRGIESLIDSTIDDISNKNELAWYDPQDPFPMDYSIDEVMMVLEAIADSEIEIVSNTYILPNGIIMIRASVGGVGYTIDGGIHKDLFNLVTYQCPPKFTNNSGCKHENKHKNQVSRTLIFWYCKDCKKEIA